MTSTNSLKGFATKSVKTQFCYKSPKKGKSVETSEINMDKRIKLPFNKFVAKLVSDKDVKQNYRESDSDKKGEAESESDTEESSGDDSNTENDEECQHGNKGNQKANLVPRAKLSIIKEIINKYVGTRLAKTSNERVFGTEVF